MWGSVLKTGTWEFPKIGGPYLGVLVIRILLFRVRWGPLFSETPHMTYVHLMQVGHCSTAFR